MRSVRFCSTYCECVRCICDAILTIRKLNACGQCCQIDNCIVLDGLRIEVDAMIFVDGFSAGNCKGNGREHNDYEIWYCFRLSRHLN